MMDKVFAFVRSCACLLAALLLAAPGLAQGPEPKPGPALEARGDQAHAEFMRAAFAAGRVAAERGDHPFGAALVHQGRVIATASNSVYADDDFTRHAEVNLLVEARKRFSPEVLRASTAYVSAAPCPMCATALFSRGISRVVYGVSYRTLSHIFGAPEEGVPLDLLYKLRHRPVDFIGPVLEDEGVALFSLWPEHDRYSPAIRANLKKLRESRRNAAPLDPGPALP